MSILRYIRGSMLMQTAVFAVLFLMCTADRDVTGSAGRGAIRGQVVTADATPLPNILVELAGSNLWTLTDSLGNFIFASIPQGTYTLAVNASRLYSDSALTDTLLSVLIDTEDTLAVDPVVLRPRSIPVQRPPTLLTGPLLLFNQHDSVMVFSAYPSIIDIRYDTVRLVLAITDTAGNPYTDGVTVTVNGVVLMDTVTNKGIIRTPYFAVSGNDLINILVDSRLLFATVLRSSGASPDRYNFLFVTTGQPTFKPYAYRVGPGPPILNTYEHVVMDESDTVIAMIAAAETVDWDIYLVNDSTGDTCSWKSRPSLTGQGDEPYFSGDLFGHYSRTVTGPSTIQILPGTFEPDRIMANNARSRRYDILVQFFDGPSEPDTATPVVYVETVRLIPGKVIEHYTMLSPPSPLRKGETWFAGTVVFPEGVVDTTGQYIFTAP
jgi:hypothetical protein